MSAMKKYASPFDIAVILKEDCKSFIIRDDSIKICILTEEWGDDGLDMNSQSGQSDFFHRQA